jgi:hypothetical protein
MTTPVPVNTPEAARYYGVPEGSSYLTEEGLQGAGLRLITAESSVPTEVLERFLQTSKTRSNSLRYDISTNLKRAIDAADALSREQQAILEFEAVLAERRFAAKQARDEHPKEMSLDALRSRLLDLSERIGLRSDQEALSEALSRLGSLDE